ncbi:MAG: Crp/Fnr family transcriptional regulator [Acuticoccus sp.]
MSCLIEKLSYYIGFSDAESRHIATLEEDEVQYQKYDEIYGVGEEAEYLFVARKGWLYSYIDLPDGRRQIVKIVHPGDIVGLPDIAFASATSTLKAAEDCTLCPFPKTKLDVIFRESPRLTALLFTIANRDLACMMDNLRAMGRMSARERIAFLLLELNARLKISNRGMTTTFRLPLNQFEIGDALGLTHTYVSRTLGAMEDDGLIARTGSTVTLLKVRELVDLAEFEDRYRSLDTTWFPAA